MTSPPEPQQDPSARWRSLMDEALRLRTAGFHARALDAVRAAAALRPNDRETLSTAGWILMEMQQSEAAERLLRPIVEQRPEDTQSGFRLGMALLQQERLAEGWPLWDLRPPRLENIFRDVGMREWQGESLAGRSILVVGEQGLGDEIHCARWIAELRARGASRITVGCQPANLRVFQSLGVDEVFDRTTVTGVRRHDFWIAAWSLPRWLGITAEAISGAPYLRAERRGKGGVGIVSRGSPAQGNDASRSMPDGLLQGAFPEALEMEIAGDVLDSLEQVAALDLLITVDTSWAHMAGALGVPVWIGLTQHGLCWRWFRERIDSPWYASARLFRQSAPRDWDGVVHRMREAFEAR